MMKLIKGGALLVVMCVHVGACDQNRDYSAENHLLASVDVFEENFDGPVSDWRQSLCMTRKNTQHCSLQQVTSSQSGSPLSAPFFGRPQIQDLGGGCGYSIEVRYARDFVVSAGGIYDLSAYVGTGRCFGCNMRARLLVDSSLVFERIGPNGSSGATSDTLEQASVDLAAGSHTIEIGMFSDRACNGTFVSYFDDIVISNPDSDGDGVADADDLCPDTQASDVDAGVPSDHLGINRWADIDGDGVFDTSSSQGAGHDDSFTMSDTRGCDCAQIIESSGLGNGHTKFGCSLGAMRDWIESISPSP